MFREAAFLSVLESADALCMRRSVLWGDPEASLGRIGRLWGALLDLPEPIAPPQVALMMCALKLSRATGLPSAADGLDGALADSLADACAYAALAGAVSPPGEEEDEEELPDPDDLPF